MGIKKQVHVAAHTSAKVIQKSEGMLLKFSPVSAFAGKQLFFRRKPGCYMTIFRRFLRFLR
jgi:hypothetical protein